MIKRILLFITDYLPARIISGDDGEPYLERYFLARLFGCEIYIHRFVASDPDRGYHNHPFAWCASLVLCGGYEERIWNPDGWYMRRIKRPGSFGWFGPNHLHRVVLREGGYCWTLFAVGPRIQSWGFMRRGVGDSRLCLWVYSQAKSPSQDWWKTAPKGKEMRRYAQLFRNR